MKRTLVLIFLVAGSLFLSSACSEPAQYVAVQSEKIDALEITSLPEKIDSNCRGGRAKIFDECSDQLELFDKAMKIAQAEGKTTLVSYGAEWCIWCHVFDAYIKGEANGFTYTFGEPENEERSVHTMYERAVRDVSQETYDLKNFVSENFILVHIDYKHSPAGDDVLSQSGAWNYYPGSIPFVFVVNSDGKYVAMFQHDAAEVRRDTKDWYRGYDRVNLLKQLKAMRMAAVGKTDVMK